METDFSKFIPDYFQLFGEWCTMPSSETLTDQDQRDISEFWSRYALFVTIVAGNQPQITEFCDIYSASTIAALKLKVACIDLKYKPKLPKLVDEFHIGVCSICEERFVCFMYQLGNGCFGNCCPSCSRAIKHGTIID